VSGGALREKEANAVTERRYPVQYAVIGLFARYGDAEAAVRDLEQVGIEGEQIELITDIDQDARTASTPGEPSTNPRAPHPGWLARIVGAGGPIVRDESGEQPNYIGEQEFYATHVKQGGAVMIVRTSAEQPASRAAVILRDRGAHSPGAKGAPTVRRMD
jgi:hypothetical protein